MLECSGLTLAAHGRTLCRDLGLRVGRGEFWAVLGPNGSGKTTLMHALAGVRKPEAGAVAWAGRPLGRLTPRERARHLALLPQHDESEFWGTVRDYVLLGRYPRAARRLAWEADDLRCAEAALVPMGIADLAGRDYGMLSGGERQRVRIAQLLAQEADCLLLDEPLQHLDLNHQGRTVALLRGLADSGRSVVIVLHDALWAARSCTHALLIGQDGRATSGTAQEVLTRTALERLYGCGLREFVADGARYLMPEI